jgi:hypothetical protein
MSRFVFAFHIFLKKNLKILFFSLNYFLYIFSNHFDILISKIKFKIKKIILIYFLLKKKNNCPSNKMFNGHYRHDR